MKFLIIIVFILITVPHALSSPKSGNEQIAMLFISSGILDCEQDLVNKGPKCSDFKNFSTESIANFIRDYPDQAAALMPKKKQNSFETIQSDTVSASVSTNTIINDTTNTIDQTVIEKTNGSIISERMRNDKSLKY